MQYCPNCYGYVEKLEDSENIYQCDDCGKFWLSLGRHGAIHLDGKHSPVPQTPPNNGMQPTPESGQPEQSSKVE